MRHNFAIQSKINKIHNNNITYQLQSTVLVLPLKYELNCDQWRDAGKNEENGAL